MTIVDSAELRGHSERMSPAEWPHEASPRTLVLRGRLDDTQASQLVAELLLLEARAPEVPVTFVVDGPPGTLRAALTLMDALGYVRTPVATGCRSRAGLTSVALLAAGARGRRWALPSATLTLAEPHEAPVSNAAEAAERAAIREAFVARLARDAGIDRVRLEQDLVARRTLSATEALEYGLIDRVGPEAA